MKNVIAIGNLSYNINIFLNSYPIESQAYSIVKKNKTLGNILDICTLLSKNNIKMHEYFEQEFTKIAARSIKSRRKTDAMLGLLLGTNIITILGVVAMYFFK